MGDRGGVGGGVGVDLSTGGVGGAAQAPTKTSKKQSTKMLKSSSLFICGIIIVLSSGSCQHPWMNYEHEHAGNKKPKCVRWLTKSYTLLKDGMQVIQVY